MSESAKKLIATLQTIFEMDKADLDFGIYRIMNQKRDEINRFLEDDLLPQVKQAFADFGSEGQADLQQELNTAIEQANNFGAPDPENAPAVLDVKKKIAQAVDVKALENDVFSKLHTFFSRYYDKGDFISQRRYKGDTYAIPYEGEEVKLYWANHDQYYIKSSEHLRDYAFIAKGPSDNDRPVRIKLVEADTEKDNIKAKSGEERRFVLDEENPLSIVCGELRIHFNFVPAGKQKQDALNKKAVETILNIGSEEYSEWLAILKSPAPTENNPNRTVLEKHLYDYTARNTFDYFVHKDLGGFLNRELDFFIKNEVMHLDDIDDEAFELTQHQIRKVKVLRTIAKKIIRMTAQLEEFQKKLWLKKRFVIEKYYCLPISIFSEAVQEQCIENEKQIEEWIGLGVIESKEQLESNFDIYKSRLLLDTAYYSEEQVLSFLREVDNLDSVLRGELVNAENFSALSLLKPKYKSRLAAICIDPPYNIGGDDFAYKDSYRSSSWLSMMNDRLALARDFLDDDGIFFSNIDDNERFSLESLLNLVFGASNKVEEIIWTQNTTNNQAPMYSTNHEYIECFAKNKVDVSNVDWMFRDKKPGAEELLRLVKELSESYPTIKVIEIKIKELFEDHRNEVKEMLENLGIEYDKKLDPWKGVYQYSNAEYRSEDGSYVPYEKSKEKNALIRIWGSDNPSRPASKQAAETKDPNHPSYCFYKPIHPETGQPCSAPNRGWAWPAKPVQKLSGSFEEMDNDHRIAWGKDHTTIPRKKIFLHEAATQVAQSVILDFTDGEKELSNLFGENQVFSNPKPTTLVDKLLNQVSGKDDIVMDFFAGSGTTGHAVLASDIYRKYILVEQGKHFKDILIPRIKKLSFCLKWRDGKPVFEDTANGADAFLKGFSYSSLESYEDILNNLLVHRGKEQSSWLESEARLKEDYLLGYWLDVETQSSSSLLNVELFNNPFEYMLNIGSGSVGATKSTSIDLVETFNYLIGLTTKSIDVIRGFKIVAGVTPKDESALIVWRNVTEKDNSALEEFLDKQGYNPRDTEFEHIYVNGDHTLEDPHSKVKMIEIEFKRLMFDVKDV